MTVIGFLWAIPVPAAFAEVSPWLNWATIAVALAIVYYFTLSVSLGRRRGHRALVALLFIVSWLDTLAWPLWLTCLVIFVVALDRPVHRPRHRRQTALVLQGRPVPADRPALAARRTCTARLGISY